MAAASLADLQEVIARHWGFGSFRPLQEQAMQAELESRDSVVVMPTGGGKSLCYQAPAILRSGVTVVVSPLIALMKDQVDGLRACGIPAVQIDSTLSGSQRAANEFDLERGEIKLLFVSPERMVMSDFCRRLQRASVAAVAIDEAHCISHWGHDFRPEYRQLGRIKELFPDIGVHAYTATATDQVRRDIAAQLNLQDPLLLVGNFDRPNLNYRVLARQDIHKQILSVVERHAGEAGIIYCMRRADVDDVNAFLQEKGIKSLPYHAGMDKDARHRVQEEFAEERCDLIVATVAFGMGIDRSNIRYILHTAMPKSIEHYQQETGRAGRDGLEAECILLFSGADVIKWKQLMMKSAEEAGADQSFLANMYRHLDDIDRYARGAVCRHKALVEYFGQRYESDNCNACDLCLGDNELVAEPVLLAQKILSCVARVQERYGINHVISVLRGENTERVRTLRHEQLSTYGLLREHGKTELREWIYQLIGQQVLVQTSDDYPVLRLNEGSWEVMRKQRSVRLLQPVKKAAKERPQRSRADVASWEGVDRDLFEALRQRRIKWAAERQVPPYVIFSDATLRELARVRPSSLEKMRAIYGIGEHKLNVFGEPVLGVILEHCQAHKVPSDQRPTEAARPAPPKPASALNPTRSTALRMFAQGASIDAVIEQTERARSTVLEYLTDHIRLKRPPNLNAWVPRPVYDEVAAAIRKLGGFRLKPLHLELGERVPYETLKLVVAHLQPEDSTEA